MTNGTHFTHIHPPSLYMREIGALWQIGVLTGKPCVFLVQNWSFLAFWHWVRAPVAIINFAFFVRGLLIASYINSEIFTGI